MGKVMTIDRAVFLQSFAPCCFQFAYVPELRSLIPKNELLDESLYDKAGQTDYRKFLRSADFFATSERFRRSDPQKRCTEPSKNSG